MKRLMILACLLAASVAGCEICDDDRVCDVGCCPDIRAPAIPTGVSSITGDGEVWIFWNPVREADLAGYGVYRSSEAFGVYTRIGEVARDDEAWYMYFVDEDVANGITYFYAVDAFDYSGNESELSHEIVDDTPRPEASGFVWYTRNHDPSRSAIAIVPDYSDELLLLPYDHSYAQYYLELDDQGCMRIVPLRDSQGYFNLIQDYGYTESPPDEVDEAPILGWSTCGAGVEVILGHAYVLRTSAGYYAKIRVDDIDIIGFNWIEIYWAFQVKHGSTELAPPRTGVRPQRG